MRKATPSSKQDKSVAHSFLRSRQYCGTRWRRIWRGWGLLVGEWEQRIERSGVKLLNRPRPTQGCRVDSSSSSSSSSRRHRRSSSSSSRRRRRRRTVLCIMSLLQRVTQQIINIIYKFCNVSTMQYAANDQQSAHQGIGQSNNALAHSSQLVQHLLAKYKIPHVQQLPHSPVL